MADYPRFALGARAGGGVFGKGGDWCRRNHDVARRYLGFGSPAFRDSYAAWNRAGLWKYAALWVLAFLAVAFFEEFFFRGYVLFTLTTAIGFWPSAILCSIVFGYVHHSNPHETWLGAITAGLVGMVFCLLLRRTGDLWMSIGFHAAWDWGETYFYGVPDSGASLPGHLFNAKFTGPAWLCREEPSAQRAVGSVSCCYCACGLFLRPGWVRLSIRRSRAMWKPTASRVPEDDLPRRSSGENHLSCNTGEGRESVRGEASSRTIYCGLWNTIAPHFFTMGGAQLIIQPRHCEANI